MLRKNTGNFKAKDIPDLTGYVAIMTGGNSGIGYETTLKLALHGARVYIASRSEARVSAAISDMKNSGGQAAHLDLHFLKLDLQDLRSVHEAAEEFKRREGKLHLLVHNAGIMAVPYKLTKDGYETQFQTNYLAPHFLTLSLMPLLLSTASASGSKTRVRIVNVSAIAAFYGPQEINYDDVNLEHLPSLALLSAPWRRYCHSKLASIMDAKALHNRYHDQGVTAYSLHPGIFKSGLQSHDPTLMGAMTRLLVSTPLPGIISIPDGARTTLFCATSPDAPASSGEYHAPYGKVSRQAAKWIENEKKVDELWNFANRELEKMAF